MKAVFENVPLDQKQVFYTKLIDLPDFDAPYHFHPEYELTYILRGSGLRYVGMRVEEFSEGELVFLGPNVPHCWVNAKTAENVAAIVVQFPNTLFENSILKLQVFEKVLMLFNQASQGLVLKHKDLKDRLLEIINIEPAEQFLRFSSLLFELCSEAWSPILEIAPKDSFYQDRFQRVFSYLIENYKKKIDLEVIAEIAQMSPSSFCRYFKNETGKTLVEVLINFRLERASQLLLRTNKRINEVAFEAGFEDIPYFNRTFRKVKGLSPSAFRKQIN